MLTLMDIVKIFSKRSTYSYVDVPLRVSKYCRFKFRQEPKLRGKKKRVQGEVLINTRFVLGSGVEWSRDGER